MCDMPIKKRMTEKRRERGGGGARECNAVEVEIYSGIGFTRFHQGPIPPPSLLQNTWCKLTLASRESRGRKEKRAKASVRDRGRHEKRKFQGLPWGLRNVAFRSLDLARLAKLLKTKQKNSDITTGCHLQQLPCNTTAISYRPSDTLYMCYSLNDC